jgi:Na+-transporting NADH:ubiquinone oxidoreductase subunit D
MSAEIVEVQLKKPKEKLFSKRNRKLITDPLNDDNPITIQVLGICSALAITVQIEQAVVMSFSVMFVMVGSNYIISVLRNVIPNRIRIIVQLVVVAFLVIVVNETLKAFVPDVSEKLSVFVGLIITNCIIMGRLEAFAMGNKPWESVLDGFGNALGYGWVLILVAFVRELFGSGSIYGFPIFDKLGFYDHGYMNNNMMILPPMALIVVALIIWVQRAKNTKLIEQ